MRAQTNARMTRCALTINAFRSSADNLGKEVGDFKSFTAKQLIELLERSGAETLLEQLQYFKLRHKIDQHYHLWQEGSQPKQIDR